MAGNMIIGQNNWVISTWRQNRSLCLFIVLMLLFRSAVADWNVVPSGSMQPTIVEGDRILVNKMAYDIRVPFTHISLYNIANPERGEIVIFDSSVTGKRMVKRVIGLPGDEVQLQDNVLRINGKRLNYRHIADSKSTIDKIEDLLGVEHRIRVHRVAPIRANFPPVYIPQDNYLVLGDNRDNSADSRAIGLVPRNEIIGRSRHVVLSLNYENYFLPRTDRFFQQL